MRVIKCDSCGVIIDSSRQAYYCISAISRTDKQGGKNGWASQKVVDICDVCWGTDTLVGLEGMVRGSGVKQDALPALDEGKDR